MKLLIMNSLDERYGSTYRIRAIADQLKISGHDVSYYEKHTPFYLKVWDMKFKSLLQSYDVLIIQKFNPLTFCPIITARLRGKHVVVDWDDWDTGLQKNIFLKFLTWLCETFAHPFANLVTSHNPQLLSLVGKGKKTLLLTQGFDPQLFDVQKISLHREQLRSKYGYASNDFVVGYMCTFTHGGTLDLDNILREFSKVTNPNVHLLLIGGGELLPSFQDKAQRYGITRIRFTGHIDHSEIPQYLGILDVGLIYMQDIKANHSRVSFKVVEYLAAGIPVMGETLGETQHLFQTHITSCPLHQLSGFLNQTLPSTLKRPDPQALKTFTWKEIVSKLQLYLQSIHK